MQELRIKNAMRRLIEIVKTNARIQTCYVSADLRLLKT